MGGQLLPRSRDGAARDELEQCGHVSIGEVRLQQRCNRQRHPTGGDLGEKLGMTTCQPRHLDTAPRLVFTQAEPPGAVGKQGAVTHVEMKPPLLHFTQVRQKPGQRLPTRPDQLGEPTEQSGVAQRLQSPELELLHEPRIPRDFSGSGAARGRAKSTPNELEDGSRRESASARRCDEPITIDPNPRPSRAAMPPKMCQRQRARRV
jgi:hypothetical protein